MISLNPKFAGVRQAGVSHHSSKGDRQCALTGQMISSEHTLPDKPVVQCGLAW